MNKLNEFGHHGAIHFFFINCTNVNFADMMIVANGDCNQRSSVMIG